METIPIKHSASRINLTVIAPLSTEVAAGLPLGARPQWTGRTPDVRVNASIGRFAQQESNGNGTVTSGHPFQSCPALLNGMATVT